MKFSQVDAFTKEPFKGNPAAVFILKKELDDELMQNIAIEMNLSETAFVLIRKEQKPLLRWFTPTMEIDLCGHATLAAAHTYITEFDTNVNEITFDTKFAGELSIKKDNNKYIMDFPARPGEKLELKDIPSFVFDALSPAKPIEAYKSRDLMLVYENEQTIRDMKPDFNALANYKDFIIVTAKSNSGNYDFISRFFCADDGITEDPVTGSAHCTLSPYWSKEFNKTYLNAYQASKRGGELELELQGERLFISGNALTVLNGEMKL